MLKPVTKDYSDRSTLKEFEFEFYCDCCKKAIKTPIIEFNSGFKGKFLSKEVKKARDIIYAADHSSAFERANIEALYELNRCEICGDMVCDDCTVYGENLNGGFCCKNCAKSEG